MSRPYWFALALFFVASPRSEAQSIAISPGQDASQVEQLGFGTQYDVKPPANNTFPFTVDWSCQQTDCTPPGSIFPINGSTFIFYCPGTFVITAKITYSGTSDLQIQPNPPPPQMVMRTVTIFPPALSAIQGAAVFTPYDTPPLTGPTASPATTTTLGGKPGCWIVTVHGLPLPFRGW